MMTPRQRWLAAVQMQPVDRLPFWPKVNKSYAQTQAPPFREMDSVAVQDWIGNDKHLGIGFALREVTHATTNEVTRTDCERRVVITTPSGVLTRVDRFDPGSGSWHPVVFPVANVEQVRILIEHLADLSYEVDPENLEKAKARKAEIGEDAVTTATAGTSALMDWVQRIAGIENAHFLLMEHPGEVQALFDAHHRGLKRRVELFAEHCPSDLIYVSENTSTSLISPDQYRTYCKPHLMEYLKVLRDAGRISVLHMCGLLKVLLPDLAEVGAHAFEAFTSPTVGNTTLRDGRDACPNVCLVGGTNATLWIQPVDRIIAQIEKDLDELPHHRGIVVTSAGVMPPACAPETIKEVFEWVKAYPVRN